MAQLLAMGVTPDVVSQSAPPSQDVEAYWNRDTFTAPLFGWTFAFNLRAMASNLLAPLLLEAMPFVPSSLLLLVGKARSSSTNLQQRWPPTY